MSELSADNRVLTGMKTKIQTQQIRNYRYLIMWCGLLLTCLLYTSPSPRDKRQSRMPSSA